MYVINKTDGTIAATVQDGVVDTTYTDLYLIGKNYQSYGTLVNDNFVRLLEHFARDIPPTKPVTGQLWYDTSANQLKVYDINFGQFKNINSAYVGNASPDSPQNGDFWYDSGKDQLKFYKDPIWHAVAPLYTSTQGISGPVVQTITDNNTGSNVTVTKMYNAGTVYAVFASGNIHPGDPISGFTDLYTGLNLATDTVLHGTITNAQSVGNLRTSQFMRTDGTNESSGTITVVNKSSMDVVSNDDAAASAGLRVMTGLELASVEITSTAGAFSCYPVGAGLLKQGQSVRITGTLTGSGSISGYVNPTTYYIAVTNGTSTFSLAPTYVDAMAITNLITTTAGYTIGLTFTVNDGKGASVYVDNYQYEYAPSQYETVNRVNLGSTIPDAELNLWVTNAAGSYFNPIVIDSDGTTYVEADLIANNISTDGNLYVGTDFTLDGDINVGGMTTVVDLDAANVSVATLFVDSNLTTENAQIVSATVGGIVADTISLGTNDINETITLYGNIEISTRGVTPSTAPYINFQDNVRNAYISAYQGNLYLGTNDVDAITIADEGEVTFAVGIVTPYVSVDNVTLGDLIIENNVITTAIPNGNVVIMGDGAGIVAVNGLYCDGLLESPYVYVNSDTNSTDIDNGALTVAGGLGVIKNINAGGYIYADGDLETAANVVAAASILGLALAANTTAGAAGTIRAADDIFAFTASDARLKDNVEVLSNSLSKVNSLRGVEFDWIDSHIAHHGGEDGKFIRKHDVGVIAQEVQLVMPEAVMERDNGTLAVNYEKIVPLLIEAIKELNQEVTGLRVQLAELGSKK